MCKNTLLRGGSGGFARPTARRSHAAPASQSQDALFLRYLAGFIDGDGSIFVRIIRREDYVLKYQISCNLSFIQKKRRQHELMQLHKMIGIGTFRDRNDGMVEINIVGSATVKPFLEQIKPYLRFKKTQANLILQIIERLAATNKSPTYFLETCQLADRLAELNDSRNRTVTAEVVRKRFEDLQFVDPE